MAASRADAIVVAFQSDDVLAGCLRSLRGDPAVDLIVVVNNSPGDGAASAVEGVDRTAYLEAPANIGFGAAANLAKEHVRNEYVVLANPDTTQSDRTVSTSIEFLERRPRAALVGPHMLYPDGSLFRNSHHFMSLTRMVVERLGGPERLWVSRPLSDHGRAHLTDYVIASFVTCRRSALDEVGWFDEDIFLFGEDQDLCRRLRSAGWEIWSAPIGEVVHRSGHSWRQLGDEAREHFRRARTRELKAQGKHVAAALYPALERVSHVSRRARPPR